MSPRAKRLLLRVGLPIAIVLGGSALAYANVPTVWKSGDTLKAADLNGNFSALDARLTALEAGADYTNPVTNKHYSLGAGYCGSTPIAYNGNLMAAVPGAANGYAAAKTLCE